MYVRRNRQSISPPVNYAGITFSRDRPMSISEEETKIHKADSVSDIQGALKPVDPVSTTEGDGKEEIEYFYNQITPAPTNEEAGEESLPTRECEVPEKEDTGESHGLLSDILGDKFTLEDILLFASLFLLISGQTDDEILLLAGLLLILSNS